MTSYIEYDYKNKKDSDKDMKAFSEGIKLGCAKCSKNDEKDNELKCIECANLHNYSR